MILDIGTCYDVHWDDDDVIWVVLRRGIFVEKRIAQFEDNGPEDEAMAKRIAGLLNAAEGIPTSELEEGRVVVVPADVARDAAAFLKLFDGKEPSEAAPLTDRARARLTTLIAALSRLQQTSEQMQGGDETC